MIRPGGIGDCLLCFPAMQELLAAYTEVWTPSAVVPLVQFADRVRSIASTGLDGVGIAGRAPSPRLIDELREFDSIVSWYGANREEFIAALDSVGVRPEFRAALPPANSTLHAVDFFLGRASSLYPRIDAIADAGAFIAVHPFSGSTHKNWPLDRFFALEAAFPLPVVYCASEHQALAGHATVRVTALDRLASWLRGAALYIGNDSGITHLAAALGVPTVAIFGSYSSPVIWAPRGPHTRTVAAASLAEVTVDDVARAARELLAVC